MGRRQTVSVLAATRLHFPEGTTCIPEVTVENLKRFAQSTEELGVAAAVAVNSLQAMVEDVLREAAPNLDFKVLHVPVWGAFVPALNTLLSEAQARGDHYILYQSLEVRCTRPVVKRLLDHFTSDTLVVGPVLDGHSFEDGVQPLTGRTSPWNTLALWKVRKLGLTGFLSIADGMPQNQAQGQQQSSWERQISRTDTLNRDIDIDDTLNRDIEDGGSHRKMRQWSGDVLPDRSITLDGDVMIDDTGDTMGSQMWWTSRGRESKGGMFRQQSEFERGLAVPAGVEEVTAIALLQHVLGHKSARAVLVQLPSELAGSVSWEAKWGGDERRKAWHEYKMASKVARPAAQIRQLFGRRRWQVPLRMPLLRQKLADTPPATPGGATDETELDFGVVQHYSDSIHPPRQVERICLVAVCLFSANFASIFGSALKTVNSSWRDGQVSLFDMIWLGLEISAVYLPMPASLWLTRLAVSWFDHRVGLAMFAALILVSHCVVVVAEANSDDHGVQGVLMCSRLIAGLGSGVLFQTRFVVASLSTMDHHRALQARQLLASDIGLGVGALLPWVASALSGGSRRRPEFASSVVLAVVSLLTLLWILVRFPTSVQRLPDRIRFLPLREQRRAPTAPRSPRAAAAAATQPFVNDDTEMQTSDREVGGLGWRTRLLLSGTLRVFIQSAAVMAMALWMRDAGMIGSFKQTKAIGALLLFPALFEAASSGVWGGTAWTAWLQERQECARYAVVLTVGIVLIVFAVASITVGTNLPWDRPGAFVLAGGELSALLLALALAQPLNASRLYALADAERSIVMLEWLKAYVGRIMGPIFAIVVQYWAGFDPLLITLSIAAVVVAVTA